MPHEGAYIEKAQTPAYFVYFMITRVVFSYGTDSRNIQNRVLCGWYHSGIQVVSRGSGYMEGHGMMVDKGLESIEY